MFWKFKDSLSRELLEINNVVGVHEKYELKGSQKCLAGHH
jgi:hypothetical protein